MEKTGIDYNSLFEHVKNLRKVLLVAAGRSGSDFFQSLLDGHSEILQFTGVWYFHIWWQEAARKNNLSDLINDFVWHRCAYCNNIAAFKSYYNKRERWDQLGDNRNEFFEVDIDTFKHHMLNILNERELNSKNFFLAINLAYGLSTGADINKTKIIFYHIHQFDKIEEFRKDFPDFHVICMVREPRNTLVSGIEHWKTYDIITYNPGFFYHHLSRVFEESEPILRYTRNLRTSKLEDLHLYPRDVFEKFCGMHGLGIEDCLFQSSYHGKKWWGDAVSGKFLDGFNKKIGEKKWKDKLFSYDSLLIKFILEDRLRHYGYEYCNKRPKIYLMFTIFLVFLPMKYELEIFTHNFRNAKTIKGKLVAVVKSGAFYIFRVLLYFKFLCKKMNKNFFLADPLLEKR